MPGEGEPLPELPGGPDHLPGLQAGDGGEGRRLGWKVAHNKMAKETVPLKVIVG